MLSQMRREGIQSSIKGRGEMGQGKEKKLRPEGKKGGKQSRFPSEFESEGRRLRIDEKKGRPSSISRKKGGRGPFLRPALKEKGGGKGGRVRPWGGRGANSPWQGEEGRGRSSFPEPGEIRANSKKEGRNRNSAPLKKEKEGE